MLVLTASSLEKRHSALCSGNRRNLGNLLVGLVVEGGAGEASNLLHYAFQRFGAILRGFSRVISALIMVWTSWLVGTQLPALRRFRSLP